MHPNKHGILWYLGGGLGVIFLVVIGIVEHFEKKEINK